MPKSIIIYSEGTKNSLNRDYNNTELKLEEPVPINIRNKEETQRKTKKSPKPKNIFKRRGKRRRVQTKEYYKTQRKTKKSTAKEYYKQTGTRKRTIPKSIILYPEGTEKSLREIFINTEENLEEPSQRIL